MQSYAAEKMDHCHRCDYCDNDFRDEELIVPSTWSPSQKRGHLDPTTRTHILLHSYTARVARHVARFGKHSINFVFGQQRLGRWNKKVNDALRYDIGVAVGMGMDDGKLVVLDNLKAWIKQRLPSA